jgi:hypothetical protein
MRKVLSKIFVLIILILPLNLFASNEFSTGEKPYIIQYRANIRSAPNKNSEVITILNINERIEILKKQKLKKK